MCAQVDDLKDIGALEQYIRGTTMILFFLSQGYFRSRARPLSPPRCRACTRASPPPPPAPQNCLREVRSSLEMNKPIVLVQEADPTKGGGTMEELREDCPETLQRSIFEMDRPHAVWMRAEEFQRVSLKIIAEAPQAAATAEPASSPHPALMP